MAQFLSYNGKILKDASRGILYSVDVSKIRQRIDSTTNPTDPQNYAPGSVWVNGSKAWVRGTNSSGQAAWLD